MVTGKNKHDNNQPKERFDFVKSVVEKEVQNIFSEEVGQYERRMSALDKERSVREAACFSKEEFKTKAKRIHEKISDELSRYKRPDFERWLPDSIDDDFIKMCEDEPDKKFVNLVVSKLIWDHSKKISGLQKIYYKKWFKKSHCLEIKWECSNCGNPNVRSFAQRSLPNLVYCKCPKCGIELTNGFRCFRFEWEKRASGKELKEKALKLKEFFLNYEWPPGEPSDHEAWSSQDQFVAFRRNKHKLPYSVRKFLDYFRDLPKSGDIQKDFDLAIDECSTKLKELETFGLIKTSTRSTPYSEIAKQHVDGLNFSFDFVTENSYGGGNICPFEEELDNNIPFYYIEDVNFRGSFSWCTEEICLNKYFFYESLVFDGHSANKKKADFVKTVFNSKAEMRQFESLKRQLPKDQSVLPNYPAHSIFDFQANFLRQEFNKVELEYLKKAIFDFVIIDEAGIPEKIIELQLGPHHKKPGYNKRDLLKKKLCEIAGLDFIELF